MDAHDVGRAILYLGVLLVAVGAVVMVGGRFLDLGNLPGDIRYESDGTRVYIPIATMIVVSIVLTIVLNVILRLWR